MRSVLPVLPALAWMSTVAFPLAAQSSPGAGSELSLFPSDISFVVRIDGPALAGSPVLERLLRLPEAANPLAQALGRPSRLAKMRAIYIGLPAGFTPESTELPVIVAGSFDETRLLEELAAARGVRRAREGSRDLLEADGPGGSSYATALGRGVLGIGDRSSILRMLDVRDGRRDAISPELRALLSRGGGATGVSGAGRVPVALRDYLQAAGGGLAAPFATIDRLSFEGSLGTAIEVRAFLHPATPEGREAIGQALGALRMLGPSRFANDPEVLSTIQSLRFTVGTDEIEVAATVPRSLLVRLL